MNDKVLILLNKIVLSLHINLDYGVNYGALWIVFRTAQLRIGLRIAHALQGVFSGSNATGKNPEERVWKQKIGHI